MLFPLQEVFFQTIWDRFASKNPTPSVAFSKNFFSFWAQKNRDAVMHPGHTLYFFLFHLASAGLNVVLTAFTGCVPAVLGRRFLSFPSPRNSGGCPCF